MTHTRIALDPGAVGEIVHEMALYVNRPPTMTVV